MSIFRRLLDWLGIASYPSHPRILRRPDLAIGVNVHADGSNFAEVKAAGFDTVLCDWWVDEGGSPELFDLLFGAAKANGLKVFVTGLPKEGDITQHARELLSRHGSQIDYLAVRNEPDLVKFYGGPRGELVANVIDVAVTRNRIAPHVKIVAPCTSSLGRSSRLGVENLIRFMGQFKGMLGLVDIIGQHIYRDTPDATLRYYRHIRKVYRDAGWTQKFFISETGYESPKLSQERQAVYVANTMAMLAAEPDIVGIAPYVLNDDLAAKDYFGIRGKRAWTRISEALKP